MGNMKICACMCKPMSGMGQNGKWQMWMAHNKGKSSGKSSDDPSDPPMYYPYYSPYYWAWDPFFYGDDEGFFFPSEEEEGERFAPFEENEGEFGEGEGGEFGGEGAEAEVGGERGEGGESGEHEEGDHR